MKIVVVDEKAGKRYFVVHNKLELDFLCKKIIRERLKAGWYDGMAYDNANDIAEDRSYPWSAWDFLEERSKHEYESIELIEPEWF